MSNTIYWYDYETFGIDPRFDRISQFGGIRTDEELNIVSDPLVIYCKPANDMLPDPQACLITGITPQKANAEGLVEAEFIASIHKEFSKPNTCLAGFNNIRFDDEFTRNCLYRNFYNAYSHEWQHGNSRWDIIDTVRLTRALRPEGIEWPVNDEGNPTIRLELLTKANNISHEDAHDAMSDVYATISIARLIKEKQPRLYDYIYSQRKKNEVIQQFNLRERNTVLHVSSRYSSIRNSIALVMPICMHPTNKNGVIVYDLSVDPSQFINSDADEIGASIFTPAKELPENIERVPLKTVHINKCPVVIPTKTMDDNAAQRLNIDIAQCETHRESILNNIDDLVTKVNVVFNNQEYPKITDPDAQLYSGGFFNDEDYSMMQRIRTSTSNELSNLNLPFNDSRLPELLFRYRARNFSQTLTDEEIGRWNAYRKERLTDPACTTRTINQFNASIEALRTRPDITGNDLVILDELQEYAELISNGIR